MTPIATVRLATCVAAATLVGTAAATLPAEARADDGPASVSESPVAVPSVDAGAVLAGEASAAVESAVADALGGDGQLPGASTPADVTPTTPSTAETTAEAVPVAAPTPEPSAGVPDTMQIQVDTAGGIAVAVPPTTQVPATSAQSSPTNVNVSVRIGSPGDSGPVTQVNVAASGASSAPSAATDTRPPTAATPGSASSTAGTPGSQPATGSPSSAQDDPGTWSWQWNCVSLPDLSAISPTGSGAGSIPKNWTWIWNCGSNPEQYQSATSTQYQPSNVNVAIRISSPGNDGPVSQTNLAVAVGAGSVAVAVHPPQAPAIAFPVPGVVSGVPSALSGTLLPGMTSLPVTVAPPEPIWVGGDMGLLASVVDSIVDVVDLPHVLPPLLGIGRTGIGTTGVGVGQMLFPSLPAIAHVGQIVPTGLLELGTRPSGEALAVVSSAAGRSASAGVSSLRAREKPAPRWRAPRPQPIQQTVPSGASIAPATGGGSSGGGIPIFLALPFLAAMLDLARRVTLDRVALPSGHRSRMPENPG